MRVKTDERRNAILAAAWKVFKRSGYEKASMAVIANVAECSKATLYSYFASKQELFGASLEFAMSDVSQGPLRQLGGSGPLEERLLAFARAHIRQRLDPDILAVERMVLEAAEHPEVLRMIREKSLVRRQRIAEVLSAEIGAGRLRDCDPVRAASHLLALIEFDLVDRWIRDKARPLQSDVADHVAAGVETFLRAHAPS